MNCIRNFQVAGMNVYNYIDGALEQKQSLLEALGIEGQRAVISVAGAGGKTSTILRLVKEYEHRQSPVAVTTTTHMKVPSEYQLYGTGGEDALFERLKGQKTAWAGTSCGDGKFSAPDSLFLERILRSKYPVLIEADGAKGMPVKAPARHEPVILEETEIVLYVFGMDAVGKKIIDVCHRSEMVSALLGKSRESKVLCEDIAALALDCRGGRKGVKDYMQYHVILNKTEEKNMAYGMKIAGLIRERSNVSCHLTSY